MIVVSRTSLNLLLLPKAFTFGMYVAMLIAGASITVVTAVKKNGYMDFTNKIKEKTGEDFGRLTYNKGKGKQDFGRQVFGRLDYSTKADLNYNFSGKKLGRLGYNNKINKAELKKKNEAKQEEQDFNKQGFGRRNLSGDNGKKLSRLGYNNKSNNVKCKRKNKAKKKELEKPHKQRTRIEELEREGLAWLEAERVQINEYPELVKLWAELNEGVKGLIKLEAEEEKKAGDMDSTRQQDRGYKLHLLHNRGQG